MVRPSPASSEGLDLLEGIEESGVITSGRALDPATGKTYPVKSGYLDLLVRRTGADSIANLTNFLPGAGPLYEPLWRVHSLTLLTGEPFPSEREIESSPTSSGWSAEAVTSTSAARPDSTREASRPDSGKGATSSG
jgi:hypothetical protein